MDKLENKIKEISKLVKEDNINNNEYIEEVLNILSSNYFENDVEELLDKYDLRDYIFENQIEYRAEKLILTVKRSLMRNKLFNYKVFIILKLLANNKQNNIVTKFILAFNKDKILSECNISENDFIKGFRNLILLGILKEEDTYYKIKLEKDEGYYLLLDRDICIKLSKESNRVIKTYLFMRDFLRNENDVWNNAKGIVNYGIINSGTGYKDKKTLKVVIDRLIELDLIGRKALRSEYKIIYEYEIFRSTLTDYLLQ